MILVFAILYIVFTAFLGQRLDHWDYERAGFCYNSDDLALPNAHHPTVDKRYLGITATYSLTAIGMSLLFAVSKADAERERTKSKCGTGLRIGLEQNLVRNWQLTILLIALLQLPLHLYSIWTLRHFNEPLLASGAVENEWAFGQTYVLIISGGVFVEFFKSIRSKQHHSSPAHQENSTKPLT